MAKLVIFQNYFTPYRWKLFHEIGKHLELTVYFMHKPEDEGRKWKEKDFVKEKPTFKTIQLPYRKIGPIIWPKLTKDTFTTEISKDTVVVFLDNLPTNLATLRLMWFTRKLVNYDRRALWVEHQWVKETQRTKIPFFNQLKFIYKIVFSWILAFPCSKLLAFSKTNEEYLAKMRLPLGSQKVYRTIQATYTTNEIDHYLVQAKQQRKYNASTISFGFLGYFSARKGIRQILTAIKFYANEHATFTFIGDGPEKAAIEQAAKADSRIHLLQYAVTEDDKTNAFLKMDVNIVASDKDPWCLVVNEAASRQVPSIVAPKVGAKEMMQRVSDELLLIDNEPMSIAKAMNDMARLKRNELKWAKLLQSTESVAKEWSIEKGAEGVIKLID